MTKAELDSSKASMEDAAAATAATACITTTKPVSYMCFLLH